MLPTPIHLGFLSMSAFRVQEPAIDAAPPPQHPNGQPRQVQQHIPMALNFWAKWLENVRVVYNRSITATQSLSKDGRGLERSTLFFVRIEQDGVNVASNGEAGRRGSGLMGLILGVLAS